MPWPATRTAIAPMSEAPDEEGATGDESDDAYEGGQTDRHESEGNVEETPLHTQLKDTKARIRERQGTPSTTQWSRLAFAWLRMWE